MKVKKKINRYENQYIKIKSDSYENLPLNKTIEIPIITIVARADFRENNKYHPEVFFR